LGRHGASDAGRTLETSDNGSMTDARRFYDDITN
jgi:hypothetical protein